MNEQMVGEWMNEASGSAQRERERSICNRGLFVRKRTLTKGVVVMGFVSFLSLLQLDFHSSQ